MYNYVYNFYKNPSTIYGYEIAPALGHTHKLTKVDATVSCTEAGNIAYYTCECGKWFADSEATFEITEKIA